MKSRRNRLIKLSKKITGCDTIVTFEPENLYYLTGFWGEAIGITQKNGNTTIVAPELEVGRAKSESINCDVIKSERGYSALSKITELIKGKKVCTDCQNYTAMESLKKSVPNIKLSSEPFYATREIKDEKETQLQSILMSYAMKQGMFDTGYRSTLNPLIIAGGPNGSLPHAQVTNRKFSKGDLIVVDLTLRYNGYISDSTRTFGLGKISSKAKEVYEIVKESQKLGLRTVKPNIQCKKVDDVCREYIKKENYEKYFIHSTGHGIGLEVHELPSIGPNSKTKLEKNMAITVEPGIYLDKKFGVRIEDSLIVKENRALILHKFTKELLTL